MCDICAKSWIKRLSDVSDVILFKVIYERFLVNFFFCFTAVIVYCKPVFVCDSFLNRKRNVLINIKISSCKYRDVLTDHEFVFETFNVSSN